MAVWSVHSNSEDFRRLADTPQITIAKIKIKNNNFLLTYLVNVLRLKLSEHHDSSVGKMKTEIF